MRISWEDHSQNSCHFGKCWNYNLPRQCMCTWPPGEARREWPAETPTAARPQNRRGGYEGSGRNWNRSALDNRWVTGFAPPVITIGAWLMLAAFDRVLFPNQTLWFGLLENIHRTTKFFSP